MFDLRPDWNLDLIRPAQDLAYVTGAALLGVSEVSNGFAARWRIPPRIPDVAVVFPVYRNPRLRRAAAWLCGQPNVLLIDPVGYPELVFLLKRCHFVVTDSGGIQEEAPAFWKAGAGYTRRDRVAGGDGAGLGHAGRNGWAALI